MTMLPAPTPIKGINPVEGEMTNSPWHPIGTILEVRGGKRLTITGYRSRVNYAAKDDEGKEYNLRRDGNYTYRGKVDEEAMHAQRMAELNALLSMGTLVRTKGKNINYGVIAMTADRTYTVAIPGQASLRISHSLVERVEQQEWAEAVFQLA